MWVHVRTCLRACEGRVCGREASSRALTPGCCQESVGHDRSHRCVPSGCTGPYGLGIRMLNATRTSASCCRTFVPQSVYPSPLALHHRHIHDTASGACPSLPPFSQPPANQPPSLPPAPAPFHPPAPTPPPTPLTSNTPYIMSTLEWLRSEWIRISRTSVCTALSATRFKLYTLRITL